MGAEKRRERVPKISWGRRRVAFLAGKAANFTSAGGIFCRIVPPPPCSSCRVGHGEADVDKNSEELHLVKQKSEEERNKSCHIELNDSYLLCQTFVRLTARAPLRYICSASLVRKYIFDAVLTPEPRPALVKMARLE